MNKFLRSNPIEIEVRTFDSHGDISFGEYLPIDWYNQVITKWGFKVERASNITTTLIVSDGCRSQYVISFAYTERSGVVRPVVIQVNVIDSI